MAATEDQNDATQKQVLLSNKYKQSEIWGAPNFPSQGGRSVRRSQVIQGRINYQQLAGRHQHELNSMSSVGSPSEYDRRNLKTAGRDEGRGNIESELLAKDIIYSGGGGNIAKNGAHSSLMVGTGTMVARGRVGKSTDATAFRRSLVIN